MKLQFINTLIMAGLCANHAYSHPDHAISIWIGSALGFSFACLLVIWFLRRDAEA